MSSHVIATTQAQQSHTLQTDLSTLEHWEKQWDMEFNPSKCQVIHITRPNQETY